jgi:hypothetical protein
MSFESKSKHRKSSANGVFDQLSFERSKRSLLRDALRPNEERDIAFRKMILSIPAGKVSTYGASLPLRATRDFIELWPGFFGLTLLTSCHGIELWVRVVRSNCAAMRLANSAHGSS